MSEPEKKSLADALKHPMANVIIGFLLTGVLGGALTNYYTTKRAEDARIQAQVLARKEAVIKLTGLNAEQIARAEQLITALEGGNTQKDLSELAELYQAANIRWRTETSPALTAAREVLPPDVYYSFRARVKTEFRARFLQPLRSCLSKSQEAMTQGQPVADVLASCQARELLEGASTCSDALMDLLYEIAGGTIENHSEEWIQETRERHRQRLKKACASPVDGTSGS
ncbi:hypothetical protein [Thiorhodococcus minor]|uniref:Uncharacterized protein n=1 Tax=Thiorhodococcus minor TaxID=57489 RepID=A0A6M0JZJ6_9GAMM|nr:hypothetical protein [Thiorhodococcus minor]NEV62920.1 hypothetical protein [Thiorhodococcus minor]